MKLHVLVLVLLLGLYRVCTECICQCIALIPYGCDIHHHHFICPIIQQYAHLHQYNLEEQDSKVRQEH